MDRERESDSEEEIEEVIEVVENSQFAGDDQKKFQSLPDRVKNKYLMLRAKNELLHKELAVLPKSEHVIQNYFCHFNNHYGKLFITQNYVIFLHDEDKFMLAFDQIQEIAREKSGLFHLFNSAITIHEKNGPSHFFSNLFHCEECYYLLYYLQCHPVALFSTVKRKKVKKQSNGKNNKDFFGGLNGNNEKEKYEDEEFKNHYGGRLSVIINDIQKEKEQYVMPDVNLAKDCNQLADEIFEIGVGTRFELENQAQMIDRIERSVDETNENLKYAQREINGIQSIGGSIKGKIENAFDKKLGAYEAPDRSAGDQEREIFFDVPILVKHKNCSLQAGLLKFGDSQFFCCDPLAPVDINVRENNYTILRDYHFYYNEIAHVIVRVRPLHLDIWFLKRPRFRCISSYLQSIVNELYLRTDKKVSIIFEFGVPRFSYGHESIRNHSLKSTRDIAVNQNVFEINRPMTKVTEEIIINAPSEVINKLEEQDESIDQLRDKISRISVNANDIGREQKRQIQQLSEIDSKVSSAMQKSHVQAYQVDRML